MKPLVLSVAALALIACGGPSDTLVTPGLYEVEPDARTLLPARGGDRTGFEQESGASLERELEQVTGAWVNAEPRLLDQPVRAVNGQHLTGGVAFQLRGLSGKTIWSSQGVRDGPLSIHTAPLFRLLALGKPVRVAGAGEFRPLLLGDEAGHVLEILLYQSVQGASEKRLRLHLCPAHKAVETCLRHVLGQEPAEYVVRPHPLP